MEADFSGYATKAGLTCSDGRTIMPGAFQHQDKLKVPLVWQHGHTDPENVLGHVILENRDDGVYAYGFFNQSKKAIHMKEAVVHDDINMMSIWANNLLEQGKRVMHGMIREVSLVLSGANPGALIENVSIRHSDGVDVLEDEAIIYTGLTIEHAGSSSGGSDSSGGKTVQEVYDSLTPEQKDVVHFMIGQALSDSGSSASHDAMDDDSEDDDSEDDESDDEDDSEDDDSNDESDSDETLNHKEGFNMGKRNVFDQNGQKDTGPVLSHADIAGIVADATKVGSLKEAVEGYALQHGINDIETLFPEARDVTTTPEFFSRRMEWVNKVLNGAHKSPFTRIRSRSADITFEDARARGYIKGNLKKEEFFGLASRETGPQTIYKKQKLDRDDIIDITSFDVVIWLKGEMRVMLDEELARAVLLGDGREVDDEDKIKEDKIRPIAGDDELYTGVVYVNIDDASSSMQEVIDAVITAMPSYRGSGTPTFFTTNKYISKLKLLRDTVGRKLYTTMAEVASEMGVDELVPVEVMEQYPEIVGVIVNMSDYTIGTDAGGQVSLFDDFDIDYNQYKYLIETRCSGALTKLKTALVVKKVSSTDVLVTPAAPTQTDDEVTVVDTTGAVYKVGAFTGAVTYNSVAVSVGTTVTSAHPIVLPDGGSVTVVATPASGYYFATSEDDTWPFEYTA